MDSNNWRPSILNGEPSMDTGDWRTQLPPDSRHKIVNKIMETLKKHLPFFGPEGINELRRIAARFEEKFSANQPHYMGYEVHVTVASLGGSVGDNCKQFAGSETSDLESTATSDGKKARTEMEHALWEEIKEINQRLIDTVVEINDDEDSADPSEGATASKGCEGITVRFSFRAISLSPDLKAHLSSTQMCPIQPLRLLVPCSYPNDSPSLLDKLSVETSKENEDLLSKAMARFNILLKSLSQPMSL